MSVSKPSTPPHWATTGTRLAPSSGEQNAGYSTNDVPSAQKLNYLLGVLYDWIAFLNDPALLSAAALSTAEADVRHGTRTRIVDLAEVRGAIGWSSDGDVTTCPTTTTGSVIVALPLAIGDRLLAVRLIGKSLGGAAGDLRMVIRKMAATPGGSATASDAVAVVQSTATANIQTVTCTPGAPITVAANEAYRANVQAFSSSGIKTAYRLEVDYDRP